jgi:hypothetical protein
LPHQIAPPEKSLIAQRLAKLVVGLAGLEPATKQLWPEVFAFPRIVAAFGDTYEEIVQIQQVFILSIVLEHRLSIE